MNETSLMHHIQLALSEHGCIVFRNNVVQAWVGELVNRTATHATLRNPRPLHAGLAVGSSDLIGITPSGHFLAVEVKTPTGRIRPEQQKFVDAVNRAGGVAGIVRSVDDALRLIGVVKL